MSHFADLLAKSASKKQWHQMSPNSLIIDSNTYELNSNNISNLIHLNHPIQKFTIETDSHISVIGFENGLIMLASLDEKKVFDDFYYQLGSNETRILGLEIDFEKKVWVATDKRLIVLDQNLTKKKEFLIEKEREYSNISLPESNSQTLKLNFNGLKLIWFKGNLNLLIFDAKKAEIVNNLANIMNLSKKNYLRN